MQNLKYLLILFIIIIAAASCGFCASEDSAYESLKAKYMRLRNTDREIAKESQWISIVNELENFAKSHREYKNAPVALSQAGGMLLEMHSVLKKDEYLQKSKSVFETITEDFKDSSQADDALLSLAGIYADDLKDKTKAIELIDELLKEYPKGDMYEAAVIRKKQLENDNYGQEKNNDMSGETEEKINVIIDPGHGGEDFGAVGVGGLYEKDVVLDISHKVKKILESKYNLKVSLTRQADEFVPLYERTGLANEANADVFVSIHANASEKKNLQGLEIYYLDNTSDKGSKKLADRENSSMQFEGPEADLRYMLSDLIQDTKLGDSLRLAGNLGASIISGVNAKGFDIKNHGTKKAPFYVLVGAYMPCVLVEIGFIDHPKEGQKLAEKAFRDSMAESFAEGISQFLSKP